MKILFSRIFAFFAAARVVAVAVAVPVAVGVSVAAGAPVLVAVAVAVAVAVGVAVAAGAPVLVAVAVAGATVVVAGTPPEREIIGPTHKARSPVATPAAKTVRINLTSLPANELRSTSTE